MASSDLLDDAVISYLQAHPEAKLADLGKVSPKLLGNLTVGDLLARERKGPFDDVDLPARQREVLEHVMLGMTDAEIAKALEVSRHRVSQVMGEMTARLGVQGRRGILAAVVEWAGVPSSARKPPKKSKKKKKKPKPKAKRMPAVMLEIQDLRPKANAKPTR